MEVRCPYCAKENKNPTGSPNIQRFGSFYRKSDGQHISRFLCMECKKSFSSATLHPCYRQNKRHKNKMVRDMLCSGNSQRRIARTLNLTRRTVVRKFLFLAHLASLDLYDENINKPPCEIMEFDDLETFEHTKCKPLSVTLAVEHKTRRILGFRVSQMAAKGRLAKIAMKKYGPRKDERSQGRKKLFAKIKPMVKETALIKSDENPHYRPDVLRHFPKCTYQQFKGQRGSIVGQGELKKIRFDPLFSLNHSCAMLRENLSRLRRKTWCTTKKRDRLSAHLALYAHYHNQHLKPSK